LEKRLEGHSSEAGIYNEVKEKNPHMEFQGGALQVSAGRGENENKKTLYVGGLRFPLRESLL